MRIAVPIKSWTSKQKPLVMISKYSIRKREKRYLSDYISDETHITDDQHLKLWVSRNAYDSVYDNVFPLFSGRQRAHQAKQATRLYFLISFIEKAGHKSIPRNVFNCITKRDDYFADYCSALEHLGYLSRNTPLNSYVDSSGNTRYFSRETQYHLNENLSSFIPDRYCTIELDYFFRYNDFKYFKFISSCYEVHIHSTQILSSPPYLGDTSSLGDIGSQSVMPKPNMHFHMENYLKLYNRLSYRNITGQIDEVETTRLRCSIAKLNDKEHRIYHYFHSLSHDVRNSNILLDGEKIIEAYDIHNAAHTLMNCILDDSVPITPITEKERYYNDTMSGKFYENIAVWINYRYSSSWNREDAKLAANRFYNISNNKLLKAKKAVYRSGTSIYYNEVLVMEYFEDRYPNILKFIFSNKDNLPKMLNEAETNVVTLGIIKTLYEEYGIEALSLHDAVYIKESDIQKLHENNISIDSIVKEHINAYQLLY